MTPRWEAREHATGRFALWDLAQGAWLSVDATAARVGAQFVADYANAVIHEARQRYEQARDAPLGTFPRRSNGDSEARARYEEWKRLAGLPDAPVPPYTTAEKAQVLRIAQRTR